MVKKGFVREGRNEARLERRRKETNSNTFSPRMMDWVKIQRGFAGSGSARLRKGTKGKKGIEKKEMSHLHGGVVRKSLIITWFPVYNYILG